MLWPVVKKNKVIFKKFLVFSQSDVQGLALLGDLKNVRPELKPNWKTEVEDNNKKPNWNSSARTKAK